MGFHVCEYCEQKGITISRGNTSSGDVIMEFASGRSWIMPDMIIHYVRDHGYLPPREFCEDVMSGNLIAGKRLQTKGITSPTKVGYLSGPFETSEPNIKFCFRLANLMQLAREMGNRIQYRGGKQ